MPRPSEDAFLGSLLGLAIGDALGLPVAGLAAADIAARFGRVEGYLPARLPDGTEVKPGEFSDESEIALCIVESLTVNAGEIDPDTLAPRLIHLARGESRRWMAADTLAALLRADASYDFGVPLDEDAPATGEVAARGVPIGLLHAVGAFRPEAFRVDVEAVVRLTHGSPAAIAAATAVGYAVRLAARAEVPPDRWAAATAAFLETGEVAERLDAADRLVRSGRPAAALLAEIGVGAKAAEAVPAAFVAAMTAAAFEDAVLATANAGGAADTIGAIAGALAGAAFGASGIPQALIDGLEGRIYVSLAAPWFFKAARKRAGLLIDLKPTRQPPRPSMPPRF